MLYTLGHACSNAVSLGSENHVNQMARLTDLELDRTSMGVGTVSIRRDPRKSTVCEYLAR